MEEYTPNSHKYKNEQKGEVADKKVEKIVSGAVKSKKKNEVQKFADVFISEDVNNVKNYIMYDVLVPTIKDAVCNIVTNSIHMFMYGESAPGKKNSPTSRVSYRSFYDRGNDRTSYNNNRTKTGYDYDDIILDNRGEAEDVISSMDDLIDTYGTVSVADLYDLVGISGNYTDNRYGWTDIRSAKVVPVRGGYLLKLPRALPLN